MMKKRIFIVFILLALTGISSAWSKKFMLLSAGVEVEKLGTSTFITGSVPFVGWIDGNHGLYLASFGDSTIEHISTVDIGDSIYGISHGYLENGPFSSYSFLSGVAYYKQDTAKVALYKIVEHDSVIYDTIINQITLTDAYGSKFLQINSGFIYYCKNDSVYVGKQSSSCDSIIFSSAYPFELLPQMKNIGIGYNNRGNMWGSILTIAGECETDTIPYVFYRSFDRGVITDSILPGFCEPTIYYNFWDFILICTEFNFPYRIWWQTLPGSGWDYSGIMEADTFPKRWFRRTESGWLLGKSTSRCFVAYCDERGRIYSGDIAGERFYGEEIVDSVSNPIDIATACFYSPSYVFDPSSYYYGSTQPYNYWILWVDPIGQLWGKKDWEDYGGEVKELLKTPEKFNISVSPNPFNSSCEIAFADCRGLINQTPTVEIFDLSGKCVCSLRQAQGTGSGNRSVSLSNRSYIWSPDKTVASGVYFVRATTKDGQTISKRIIYLR
jgi:hypothetical protein